MFMQFIDSNRKAFLSLKKCTDLDESNYSTKLDEQVNERRYQGQKGRPLQRQRHENGAKYPDNEIECGHARHIVDNPLYRDNDIYGNFH